VEEGLWISDVGLWISDWEEKHVGLWMSDFGLRISDWGKGTMQDEMRTMSKIPEPTGKCHRCVFYLIPTKNRISSKGV